MEKENYAIMAERREVKRMATLPTCPRCDAKQTLKIADSPVKGKWEVYRCPKCNYLWRSTETLEGIVKLTGKIIDEAIPTVP
jgi:predicted Zn finger-like uncharacterized protein